jgi:hypothetical protein
MDKENARIVIVSSRTHNPLDLRNSYVTNEKYRPIFTNVDTIAKAPIKSNEGIETWKITTK